MNSVDLAKEKLEKAKVEQLKLFRSKVIPVEEMKEFIDKRGEQNGHNAFVLYLSEADDKLDSFHTQEIHQVPPQVPPDPTICDFYRR